MAPTRNSMMNENTAFTLNTFVVQAIEGFELQDKTRKPADKFGSEQV